MRISLPDINLLIKKILPVEAYYTGDYIRPHPALGRTRTQSIEQWRLGYLEELKSNNSFNSIGKFKVFVASILSRANRGETVGRLYNAFNSNVKKFDDLNKANIRKVLEVAGYRFQSQGVETIIDVKNLFLEKYQGDWNKYLKEAKRNYRNNFLDDDFLEINGIGFKVRDLALSCFLKEYSANDFHVVDVLVRTGLILYGYGDLNFGTNPNDKRNYLFLRSLVIKLSDKSGYSSGELDRIFWHFGRVACKNKPVCERCAIKDICLTYKNKS